MDYKSFRALQALLMREYLNRYPCQSRTGVCPFCLGKAKSYAVMSAHSMEN